VVLVGDEDQVSKELSKYPTSKLPIFIHHAPFVVAMHDSPSTVIRRMKDTSIKVALDLAKEGQVNGVVSAGNSGAAMALAMYILKNWKGWNDLLLPPSIPPQKATRFLSIPVAMWIASPFILPSLQ
jgi:glycerol-3-phosphate acyltransferase PlsX